MRPLDDSNRENKKGNNTGLLKKDNILLYVFHCLTPSLVRLYINGIIR